MLVEVGQQAPDATLVSGDRKAVKISELRGKTAVLVFFPAAFTNICTKEMRYFRDDLDWFTSAGAEVIGISADTPFTLAEFARQHSLKQTLLSDFNHQAMKAFGVYDSSYIGLLDGIARRSIFVLDKGGKIAYKWITDKGGIEPPYKEVEAAVKRAG